MICKPLSALFSLEAIGIDTDICIGLGSTKQYARVTTMLNLISDPWIPVARRSGRDTVRPDQIAEPDVLRPDWPRPDLNLACFELLVGLTYLAHPPQGRRRPR